MVTTPSAATSEHRDRVPQVIWVGIVAVAVDILLAAGLGNLVTIGVPERDEVAQFSLSHLIPLPISIILAVLFLRWAGWGQGVWEETPTPRLDPHRWYLILIPVIVFLIPLVQIGTIDWGARSAGFIIVVSIGTLMVGFTEELYLRGILLAAVRSHHGEFLTLLITSLVFAAAHVPGAIISGLPLPSILFEVAFLALAGAGYYWVRRVTGAIWWAMLAHALTDWQLYLSSGSADTSTNVTNPDTSNVPGAVAPLEIVLTVLTLIGIISVIREDMRARRARRVDT